MKITGVDHALVVEDVEMGPADLFGARATARGLSIHDPAGNRVEPRAY